MALGATVFQCDWVVALSGTVDYFDTEQEGQKVTLKADLYEPTPSGGHSAQGDLTLSYEPEPLGYARELPLEYNKRYVVTISEWVEA